MSSLPEADPATRAFFLDWLERFSAMVRGVDYAAARPLWHPDVVIFGTHQDLRQGLDSVVATQWENVWPRTADFRFVPDQTRVMASDDGSLAVVIAPWTSAGFRRDGARFDRPGRASLVFHRNRPGWLCVHSHMSLNRGVPQDSFADRPAASPG